MGTGHMGSFVAKKDVKARFQGIKERVMSKEGW